MYTLRYIECGIQVLRVLLLVKVYTYVWVHVYGVCVCTHMFKVWPQVKKVLVFRSNSQTPEAHPVVPPCSTLFHPLRIWIVQRDLHGSVKFWATQRTPVLCFRVIWHVGTFRVPGSIVWYPNFCESSATFSSFRRYMYNLGKRQKGLRTKIAQ